MPATQNTMSATVEKESVLRMLQHCSREAGERVYNEDHLNLEIRDGWIRFSVMNSQNGLNLSAKAECKTEGEGLMQVRASDFVRLIQAAKGKMQIRRSLPGEKENFMVIEQNGRKAKMVLYGEEDDRLPPEELGAPKEGITLEARRLLRLIEITAFSMGRDETRPNMNGILLQKEKGEDRLQAVSTDGHRCNWADAPAKPEGAIKTLVQPSGIQTITQMLKNIGGDSEVRLESQEGDGHILVQTGCYTAQIRIPDCELFPDYGQVERSVEGVHCVHLNAGDFLSDIEFSAVFKEASRRSEMRLEENPDRVSLKISNADSGQGESATKAIELQGGPASLFLNFGYLQEAVMCADPAQAVEIQIKDGHTPLRLRPVQEVAKASKDGKASKTASDLDVNWWCILMPMR